MFKAAFSCLATTHDFCYYIPVRIPHDIPNAFEHWWCIPTGYVHNFGGYVHDFSGYVHDLYASALHTHGIRTVSAR